MDSNQQHPLLNPVVVDILMEYISNTEDLRQVRLVCQLWNERTFTKWRSMIATATIGPSTSAEQIESLRARRSSYEDVPVSSLNLPSRWNTNWSTENFMRLFQDPRDPCQLVKAPFKRIILSDVGTFNTRMLRPRDDTTSPNFWNSVGPLVTHVTFKNCRFEGNRAEIFERIIAEKLASLQSLTLINCTTDQPKPHWFDDERNMRNLEGSRTIKSIKVQGSPPINFCRLSNIGKNIETLTLDDNLTYTEVGPYRFPEFMGGLLRMGRWLKHLDIMDQFVFDHLPLDTSRQWQRLNFHLEHFSLIITGIPLLGKYEGALEVKNILAPAIRQFAGTLKVLKIFRPPVNMAPRECPFPDQMDSLKELNLSGNVTRSLDFLGKTPNLKVLHVDFRSYDNLERMKKLFHPNGGKEIFAEKYKPFEERGILNVRDGGERQLEQMEHFHINLDIIPTLVPVIADWMPNLRCLEAVLLKDGFRAICRGLPNLEELVLLHDSQVDDDALTEIAEFRNPANITALRCLKKFQLKQLCDAKKYRLGNKSVYIGFLKMATLQSVHICVTEKMTAEAEAALKEHVSDVQVTKIHVPSIVRNLECCKLSKFLEINNILT